MLPWTAMYVSLSGVRILAGSSEGGDVAGLRVGRVPTRHQEARAGAGRAASPRRARSLWKLPVTSRRSQAPESPAHLACRHPALARAKLSLSRP